MSIFFSCNSFLCLSFEVEKTNQKPAIDMAPNIIQKIRIISLAIDDTISFIFNSIFNGWFWKNVLIDGT